MNQDLPRNQEIYALKTHMKQERTIVSFLSYIYE